MDKLVIAKKKIIGDKMLFNFSNQTIDHSKVDTGKDHFRKLISDGYFVVPKLLDQTFLERLQDVTNRIKARLLHFRKGCFTA